VVKYKVCNKCKIKKPISEFYNDKSRKDGKHACCKKCSAINNRLYYKNNKKKLKKQVKINYQNKKEEIKIKNKIRYYANRERNIKISQQYVKTHKKEIAIRSKKYLYSQAVYNNYVAKISFAEKVKKRIKWRIDSIMCLLWKRVYTNKSGS